MNDHYYTDKPASASKPQSFEASLRGFRLKLTSDAGVFAREGVDYGSRALIERMEIGEADRVLDIGCGYGPIGLTAAKLAPNGHVTMTDINGRAVELAGLNAKANGVANVTVVQGDRLSAVVGAAFDTILSNPPIRAGKAVVHAMFEEAYARLRQGGALWIVIQKKQGAPSAKARLEELFGAGNVSEIGKDKGYRVYRSVRA